MNLLPSVTVLERFLFNSCFLIGNLPFQETKPKTRLVREEGGVKTYNQFAIVLCASILGDNLKPWQKY